MFLEFLYLVKEKEKNKLYNPKRETCWIYYFGSKTTNSVFWLLIVMGEEIQLNPNMTATICIDIPPYVNSKGLWVEFDDSEWWLNPSLPLLEFQLIVLCFSLAITYFFLKRFGISKLSCQILVSNTTFK